MTSGVQRYRTHWLLVLASILMLSLPVRAAVPGSRPPAAREHGASHEPPAEDGPRADQGPLDAGPPTEEKPPVRDRGPAASSDGDGPPAVLAVDVHLLVFRGGEHRPDGRRVPRAGAWVQGTATYELDRPARAGDRLVLLDFAASMPREPAGLDEVALGNIVDGPYDPGGSDVTAVDGARIRRIGDRGDLEVTLVEGAREFSLRHDIEVPHRYWPFGCVWQRCALTGAVAPIPSVPARGGVYLPPAGRVAAPARWHVEAQFATPGELRPNARVGDAPQRRPDEIIIVGSDVITPYPSVFFGPRWHADAAHHGGLATHVHTPKRRPTARVPDERPIEGRADIAGIVHRIVEEAIELTEAVGQPAKVGERLVVVQGPLRQRIAESHPGLVLVSDQAYELFPIARFRKFHEEAMARATIDVLIEARVRGHHDPSTGLWLAGSVGFAVLELWRAARDVRDEFAHDLLHRFTFVPAVDRFLYTQQASFSGAYFRGVEDEDPVRNHPAWYSHKLPTGRRIHEKLVDTLGGAGVDRFYRMLLADLDVDPRTAAEQVYGRELDWFFAQWLGPYPQVNYAVRRVDSQRDGDGWVHHIVVEKTARRPIIEPVQVLVTDRGGTRHYLVWNGELGGNASSLAEEPSGGRHTFVVHTRRRLRSVRLDPRTRLVETPLPVGNVDPLFDNRRPASFRFLYTGVGLSIAASEFLSAATAAARFNAITGFAQFEGSLRRDLRRTGTVQIARDRETDISVGAGAHFWFGRKVNRQRRRSRVRLFQSVSLLNGRSLDPRGGVRLQERISIIDDTRGFAWWPERGYALALSAGARHTLRTESPRDDRHDLLIDANWVHLWRLAKDHVIATSVFLEWMVPLAGRPEFRALPRVGGIGGLSGYQADEAFGLGVVSAQLEYRHVFINDIDVNLAHLAWLRSLGGVLFAGTASASECESLRGWFGRDSWYANLGYALTGYFSILGVTPQVVRLEVSAPLVRYRGERCLTKVLPDYLAEVQRLPSAARILPPVYINLTFQQSF